MRGANCELDLLKTEVVDIQNLAPQVVETQKIPLNLHYAIHPLDPLGVRGTSWERGEGHLAQQRWWAPQNLALQVVGTPKHTTQSPLHPTSAQSIGSEGSRLGARGGPNRGGGHPKTWHHKWWGPQKISLDLHYTLHLPPASCPPQRWWGHQNIV